MSLQIHFEFQENTVQPIISIVLIPIRFYNKSINQNVEFEMANQEKNFKNEFTCLMMKNILKLYVI